MQEHHMRLFSGGQTDQSMALCPLQVTGDAVVGCVFALREEQVVPLVALGDPQAFCLADRDKPGKSVFAMVPAQRTRKAIAL